MFLELFATAFYNPLYNGLIFLISIVPFADVGVAVIFLTVMVKLVLFPLSLKAVKAQLLVKQMESTIKELREKYEKNKQEQARKIMELYKEKGINPLSSVFLILIQIPIIFALYWVFFRGGLPAVNEEILYSFTKVPSTINMNFLTLVDVSERSAVLALLAGVTQFFQVKLSFPEIKKREKNPTLKDDLTRSFQMQMRYMLPVIVAIIAYFISAAIALYWTTSNIFAIGQELYVRKNIREKYNVEK